MIINISVHGGLTKFTCQKDVLIVLWIRNSETRVTCWAGLGLDNNKCDYVNPPTVSITAKFAVANYCSSFGLHTNTNDKF